MADLQQRCLFFLIRPFTVVFQHQHLLWRTEIAIASLAQVPARSVFQKHGKMQFSQGRWWSTGKGLLWGRSKGCVVCWGSFPWTDHCSDLWEDLLHTVDKHCGHRDRFPSVPLWGFVGLRSMKSRVSLNLVQGKPSSGGAIYSCCSLSCVVSMLALVFMLTVFVDFLRKKKFRSIFIVNV